MRHNQTYTYLFQSLTVFVLFVSSIRADVSATVSVSKNDLQNFCGTAQVKIAFTNERLLYYVDFTEDQPIIRRLQNVSDAAIPVISPDGQWVIYATETYSDARTSGSSTAWICELKEDAVPVRVSDSGTGYVPRFVYSALDTPVVIYSTCGISPDYNKYIWEGCGQVVSKKVINGIPHAQEQVIYGGGSYFGGLSYDDNFLGTSENELNGHILDLRSPDSGPKTVHTIPTICDTGTSEASLQTCNPSMSSSRIYTDALMFLDFGFDAKCEPSNMSKWEFHARIFITNSNNEILSYYDSPSWAEPDSNRPDDQKGIGEVIRSEWAYSEWSHHPYYAVANERITRLWKGTSFYNTTSLCEKITLINLKDSLYLPVITSADTSESTLTDMKFPALWVYLPDDFIEQDGWVAVKKNYKHIMLLGVPAYLKGQTVIANEPIKEIAIYSLNGRQIWSEKTAKINRINIDLQYIQVRGIYLVRVITQSGSRFSIKTIPRVKGW